VIEEFMAARRLPDVTVAADAGMISEANQKAIEAAGLSFILGMAAGLSFILGMKVPHVPDAVARRRREHPAGTQASRRGWLRQSAQARCPVPRPVPRLGWPVASQLPYPLSAWIAAARSSSAGPDRAAIS
jgi:hypothetical protein